MQQPISRRDSHVASLAASIGNRSVALASASIDRELPDPVQGGSLTAASGTLSVVEGDDVVDTVATPWDPGTAWPPVPEAAASVSMDMGAGPVQLLTGGRVVSASGGTGDREVSVEVADRYQSLDKTISWDAVAATMPSLQWDWDAMRYVGMNGISIVDMILRHCGWYSTPPPIGYSSLSVPAQGTMWPESGLCVTAKQRSDGSGYPIWRNASWGVGVDDFEGSYSLGGSYSMKSRGRVELCAMVQNTSGTSSIAVSNSSGNGIHRLLWNSSTAYIQARNDTGSYQTIVSVPRANGFLYATIEYVSDSTVLGTIRSGGESRSATLTGTSVWATTHTARTADLIVEGVAGGFQVAFPSASGRLAGWTPNAVLYPRASQRNHLEVRRSEAGVNCAEFLQRLCEAEVATYWIDETGVLRWWDMARLEAQSSVATLTSDEDITDAGFTWDHSLSSVRSRVAVSWRQPLRAWSASMSTDLWQGNGGTLQAGEVREDWINVPDDEVWIMTDTNIRRAPGAGIIYDFNYGWGSWYGATGDRGDGVDTWAQSMPGSGSLLMTVERVNDRAFKTWVQWTGTTQVMQRAVSEAAGGSVWLARRGMDLPIIRGKAKFTFTDRLTYSVQRGSASAPEMGVDVDWLIQDEAQAQYVADYYGARVTIPQPVLSSIALVPVPGLQLGDMVEVRDEHVTRLTVRGLVVADSRSIDAGMDMQHAVAIRPLYVTRNNVLWRDWGRVVGGDQYQEWGSRQSGKTYQQWGANPLLGEDVI